jgi:hypothetical protein
MLDMKSKEKIEEALNNAEKILNQTYQEYCSELFSSEGHRKFWLLKMQAALFQFEMCSGMDELMKIQSPSFARKAVLKDLIHKVFEYKKSLKGHYIKKLDELAENKNLDSERVLLSEVSKKYRIAIKNIEQYKPLRNAATGHYDPDIQKQLSYIEDIKEDEALELISNFLIYNKEVLKLLRDIGKRI